MPFWAVHLLRNFTMKIIAHNDTVNTDSAGALSEVCDRNFATSAAIVAGGFTVGLGGAVAVAVVPAHMTLLAGTTAALAYVGDRQFKNLPLNPFDKGDKDSNKSAESATEAATA